MEKRTIDVGVICRNANGEPDIFWTTIYATRKEIEEGLHYDLAEAAAQDNEYDGPFICVDEDDALFSRIS